MSKTVLYYRQQKNESVENSIENVKKLIKNLETTHKILGVFLDSYNDQNQLNEMLNFPLQEIDLLYTNHCFDDEFDNQLINQLSKAEQFSVKYFDKI
ncbi:hypothetical protein [Bacillus cereus]|uniref:hypothetical protein n=1 Tax=Bacillus cereus TaxID=1396 RepID=UPI0010919D15|nr:hypothetical protein [Bacillus cereus]QBZ23979.1 hypothetical protein FORC085_910 [Bacillus cereus]